MEVNDEGQMPTPEAAKSGRVRSGKARMEMLTPEQRSELARRAAESRWAQSEASGEAIAQATHVGEIRIGQQTIPCAVLSDGRRVLSQRGVGRALGRGRGGSDWRKQAERAGGKLPFFLAANNLIPFVSEDLALVVSSPILYRESSKPGALKTAHGIEASALPQICDVWLKARDAKALHPRQESVAIQADILMRGLAHTGIIALIDEATGYQQVRDKKALEEILNQYIGRELAKWAKRFPDEFYAQMFRLKGWKFDPLSSRRPMQMAQITIDLVYDRIGPGLTKELRERRQKVLEDTGKKGKLQQLLTSDVGHPALQHHISGLTFLGKAFNDGDWDGYYRAVERVAPRYNRTLVLPFPENETSSLSYPTASQPLS